MSPRGGRAAAVWVLNLEAEHELEHGAGFTPSAALRAIVARERRRLLGTLVAPGDLVLDEHCASLLTENGRLAEVEPEGPAPPLGLCWSPTPAALERLARAGAAVPKAPCFAVLRAVNARPFAARVRAPLAGESFAKGVASTLDEVLALVARPAPDGWLVRRTFGAAGRGRRRLAAGRPDAAGRAWIAAGLRRGPLTVEPWVRVTREHTRSGAVAPDGSVTVFGPCLQRTTRSGAWIATERAASAADVGRAADGPLEAAAYAAGAALAAAGYHGPFGVDAFHHLVPGGSAEVLNPLGEINARFTMDWTAAGAHERAALQASHGAMSDRRAW